MLAVLLFINRIHRRRSFRKALQSTGKRYQDYKLDSERQAAFFFETLGAHSAGVSRRTPSRSSAAGPRNGPPFAHRNATSDLLCLFEGLADCGILWRNGH